MTPPVIAPGGFDPHDGGMEARMANVEDDVRDMKGILRRLEPTIERMDAALTKLTDSVHKVEIELAELKGRVSQLPTTLQLLGFVSRSATT